MLSFLNPAILIGLGLVAVPIVIHFLLKQKPKIFVFPALRLIQQRRKQSMRRMRLKHFWLLLLRMLVLALIVLAIARPSLPPANYGLSGLEIGLLIGVLVIALGIYFSMRWQINHQQMPRFRAEEKQSKLRNYATAGTLGVLLFAVGCPYQQRISAELTDPKPFRTVDLPVAGVMLFDTSLSMSYLQEGKTSLDRAKEIAVSHLETLPVGSRVAIGDNSDENPILFQTTMLSAQSRIGSLEIDSSTIPVDRRLEGALRAQRDDKSRTLSDQGSVQEDARRDRYIRRIYLFTDLAKSAWKNRGSDLLKSSIEEQENVNVYVIDVGNEDPQNVAITDVQLSRELIPIGGDLTVTATVNATGADVQDQVVEIFLQNSRNQLAKHGKIDINVDAGIPVKQPFPTLSGLNQRSLHGEVKLAASDPLAFDNVRHFSAEVIPAPKVLVVGQTYEDAFTWMTALAPLEGIESGKNSFLPEYQPVGRLSDLEFSDYATVTLINCKELSDDVWFKLGRYVQNGGGLILVVGDDEVSPISYNRGQAQKFLPASLDTWQPINRERRMQIKQRSHPLFWKFRQLESFQPFGIIEGRVRINRFWKVDQLAENANVLAEFVDEQRHPGLIERSYGRGRTLMFLTDASNTGRDWNNFASTLVDWWWVFVSFTRQSTEFVSRYTDIEHNFSAGETPVIPIDPPEEETRFLLREPELKQSQWSVDAGQTSVAFKDQSTLGSYDVYQPGSRVPVRGFSINAPSPESDLTRLTKLELDDLLGENQYEVARDVDELKDDINASDLGQEVYPMLIMLVVVCFVGEHLVASYFYGRGEPVTDDEAEEKLFDLLAPSPQSA